MKKTIFTFIILVGILSPQSISGQIFIENFDGSNTTATTTVSSPCNDGGTDYFDIVCENGNGCGNEIGTAVSVGASGQFFGAQDTNGDPGCPGATGGTLSITGINIIGETSLVVCFDVAEDDASDGMEDWDGTSQVSLSASIDGGSSELIFDIQAAGGTNTEPGFDCNGDGLGDGLAITNSFTTYCASITATGSSMDIVMAVNGLNDGEEDIAIDNIAVYSASNTAPNSNSGCTTTTSVQFTAATSSVAENGGSVTVCAAITNPDASNATTVEVALAGSGNTATNGTDYTMVTYPVTLTFPAGSPTDQCVTFMITDDTAIEGSETIDLILQNPAGGSSAALGSNTTHTLTITDNDVAGCDAATDVIITEFSPNPCSDLGSDGLFEFVEFYNNGATAINLENWELGDNGEAFGSTDFTFPSASIPPNSYFVVAVTAATYDGTNGLTLGTNLFDWNAALNNAGDNIILYNCAGIQVDLVQYTNVAPWPTCPSNDGCFTVALPTANYGLDNNVGANWEVDNSGTNNGSPGLANTTNPCPTTTVQFASTTSTIAENGGSVMVCVSITEPDASTATTVEVALAASGNTATNGTDYTSITFPVTLTFPAGSSTDQCVTFAITDDALVESNETIDLILQNSAGGANATLGTNTAHALTITDNDSATTLSFDALPDCDNMTGPTAGTVATANTMYIHIDNMMNADISSPTTFTSSSGSVAAGFIAGMLNGPIQITGLTAADYGTIITLTANNNGNTATIQVPIIICGFSVENGGNGQTPNATTNGTFCTDPNGIVTAPGILVESVPSAALSSGNNITSTYIYVLVDTDNSNTIITKNNTGLFSSPDVMSGTNYAVYAFNVDNGDLAAFETAIVPGTTPLADLTGMMNAFSSLCYSECWTTAPTFSPDCFICPTLTTLTDPADICVGDNFAAITASGFTAAEMNQTIGGGAFGVQFVTFTGTTAPTDAYTGGTNLGAIANADLTTTDTEATLAANTVGSSLAVGSYQLCAILSPVPTAATCRPQVCQTIVINPLPVLTAQTPTICASENPYNLTSLQSAITSATGTFAYAVGATAVTDPTMYTAANSDIVTVTFTDGTTTCTNTTTITFTVNPLPILAAQTPTICASENPYNLTSLQSAITSATGTFAYTVGATAVADPTMYTAANGDVVTVTFTDGTTSCANTTTITFTVNPLPILTAQTPTICEDANPYNLTSLQSAITSTTGTFAYAIGATAVTDPTMYTATTGDVITVTFTDGITSCVNTTTITFTVNSLPTAAIALSETALCSTSSGTNLTISGTPGAQVIYSVDGVNQAAITIEGDGSNDIAVNPSATTVYTLVSVTNTTTTCSQNLSDSVTLTISNVSCNGAFPWSGNN